MDFVGLLALVVFLGSPCAYITRSMMLLEKDSHEGPFRSERKRVRFSSGHVQSVALFDWIRRLFGVYHVEGDYWTVLERRNRVEAFTCPFCLSFWTAIPLTGIALLLLYATHRENLHGILFVITVMALPVHFGIAIVAQLIYKALWGDE